MMQSLLTRTIYEKRWFILGWGAVYAIMSALVVVFYPSFKADGSFDALITSMPEQLRGLIGDPSVFSTLPGYITSQVYDIRMSLIIVIAALTLAIGLTVKEEESGDMRTTLIASLSRDRYVLERWVAAAVILTMLNLSATVGIYLSLLGLGETIPHQLIWQCFGLSSLFALSVFSIPYAIGVATGKRAVTMTIGLIVAIGSYLLATFSQSVDWLKDWSVISLMHYFDTNGLRTGEFSMSNIWVLSLIALLATLIGLWRFRKRDIA